MTPWTRLEGTPLWDAAAQQYAKNDLDYHDMSHVGRLYAHAERFRLPYDPSLDRAILTHDVILDLAGGNEARSAVWLRDQLGGEDRVATRLIMTTVQRQPPWPVATTTLAGGAERKTGMPVWRAVPPA
jgi:predicted metal-dependent HD superfamily phosphohydrolase